MSRRRSRRREALALLLTLGALGCTGSPAVPLSITLTPSGPRTLGAGQSVVFTATVVGDAAKQGVHWSLQGAGSLDAATQSLTTVTYQAPATLEGNQSAAVTATSEATPTVQASTQLLLSSAPGPWVVVSPGTGLSLETGQTLGFTASVVNDPGVTGVTWSLEGVGSLLAQTSTTVTYLAPASVSAPQSVTLTATSTDGVASDAVTVSLVTAGMANVAPVVIDSYDDVLFVTVTVCVPGTLQCDTIDHVQVDTGSVGLRLASGASGGQQTVPLPRVTVGGQGIQNCISFVDMSYLWGDVALADVQIGSKRASSIPVQVAQSPTAYSVPSRCSNGGTGATNASVLRANGILGIGTEPTDCTLKGTNYCTGTAPAPLYWACTAGGCPLAAVEPSKQMVNPVTRFVQDSNGTLLVMPAVNHVASSLTGSLLFGINTRSNNALGSATLYTLNSQDMFTTTFSGQTLPSSYLDSGTNGLFFPSALPVCSGNLSPFYCPASSQALTAQNAGSTQGSGTVGFTIDNASATFSNQDSVYSGIGGPNSGYPCSGSDCSFSWGMPFFFGKRVFTAIDGQSVAGVNVATPFWAY